YQPFALALHTEALMAAGRMDQALDVVSRGLTMGESTGERFYAAELLRLKGLILAHGACLAEAEQCMRDAIEIARAQDAKLFELRSAVSLCRLLDGERKHALLRTVVAPLCDVLAKQSDTPDVNEARALLGCSYQQEAP